MFERNLSPELVSRAVREGEIIAEYPEDRPFPSALILYREQNEVIHVVSGMDEQNETCYIITAYRPDPAMWSNDFRTRRQS